MVLLKAIDVEFLECWYVLQIKKVVVRSLASLFNSSLLNPFQVNRPFLYFLKRSRNQRFSDVLEGIERENWPQIHQLTSTTTKKILITSISQIFHESVITLFLNKRSFEPSSAKFGFKSDTILLNVICVFQLGRNRCFIIGNVLKIFKIEQKEG